MLGKLERTLVVFAVMFAPKASAMTRIHSDGRATISELEILVEPEAWTLRARIDGNARQLAIVFSAPGATGAEVVDASVLDALDHRTAPRMETTEALDPCVKGEAVATSSWPQRKTPPAPGFTARRVAGEVTLSGPAPGKLRGFWTPPVRIAVKARSLPIGVEAVTPGVELRVELWSALAPKRESVDLPSSISFPELVLEDPLDLYRAITAQTIRREGGAAVRVFSGDVSRWVLLLPRNAPALELEPRPLPPFTARWSIRRLWRGAIACSAKERYLANARLQQKAEIQTYAATTGRTQASIEARMRAREDLVR